MAIDSYFRFDDDDDDDKVHVFSQPSQEKWVSWIHTAPYIAGKIIEIIKKGKPGQM